MKLSATISFTSTIRWTMLGVLLAGWGSAIAPRANALIVDDGPDQSVTTVAPPSFPLWNNFTLSNSRNYFYLGNSWALSAFHVGLPDLEADPFDLPEDENTDDELLHFSSGSFTRINGRQFTVRNPANFPQVATSPFTDLRLIRLNGDPEAGPAGLKTMIGPSPDFTIASTEIVEATANKAVMFVGAGPSRATNQTEWKATVVAGSGPNGEGNDTWTEGCGVMCTHSGYNSVIPADHTKRWGMNQIADEDCLFSTSTSCGNPGSGDTNLRGVIEFLSGAGPRYVMSMFTRFDQQGQGGVANEAQAVGNDSGSAVFYHNGGNWELRGIVNFAFAPFVNGISSPNFDRRPNAGAAPYGSFTSFADLSYYRDEIMAIINDPLMKQFSIEGDINLDGVVSGDGSGSVASDDVAAFIAGWGDNNGKGYGDYTSWTSGDLNLDGKTDAADFFVLRNVLAPPGSAATLPSLESLLAASGVPEPSSVLLVLIGVLGPVCSPRRNRRW